MKKRAKRGCCGPITIASTLRFDPKSAESTTREEREFGKAMVDYLAIWKRVMPTCGEACDVMCGLGYKPPKRDFRIVVEDFRKALDRYKKTGLMPGQEPERGKKYKRRAFPLWSEVLGVLIALGWKK